MSSGSASCSGAKPSAGPPAPPTVSPPGSFAGRSALGVYLIYEVHMRVMIHHVNGAPLPAEAQMGLASPETVQTPEATKEIGPKAKTKVKGKA